MPRIKQNRDEYIVRDELKQLHGQLLAEGIRDVQVGQWLNCSGQNVGKHFKNASFSYKQVRIIQNNLAAVREANERKGA